jgi:16S rRNA (cytosine967-C5)-methyltransferase
MAADNREPPLMLRVNRQRSERAALIEQLQGAGYAATPIPG